MIAPYFTETAIISDLLRDYLGPNHPFSSIENVVNAMVSASTDRKRSGVFFLIDPKGVFVSKSRMSPMVLPNL